VHEDITVYAIIVDVSEDITIYAIIVDVSEDITIYAIRYYVKYVLCFIYITDLAIT